MRRVAAGLGGGALLECQFRLLFVGQTISALGDRLVLVALPFAVLHLTGSPADVGYVFAAQTLPLAALLLFGGVWADRLPRNAVMLGSDLVRGAAQLGLAVAFFSGRAELWQLVVAQAVFGVADAFFQPAATGLVPQTVRPERLQEANALLKTSMSVTTLVGPAAAGAIVTTAGPGWAFAGNAASFGLSALALALMAPTRVARRDRATVLGELRDGWHEFASRRWVWASVLYFSLFQMVVLSAFFVLGPFVVERSLGGAGDWGLILTFSGAGSVVGGLVALRSRSRRILRTMFLVMFSWVPLLVLLAVAAPRLAIGLAAFVASAGLTQANVYWSTALQRHIPAASISRVSAYDWFGSVILNPVGYALVGPLTAAVGSFTVLMAAAAWLAVSTTAVLLVGEVSSPPTETEPGFDAVAIVDRAV